MISQADNSKVGIRAQSSNKCPGYWPEQSQQEIKDLMIAELSSPLLIYLSSLAMDHLGLLRG